MKIKFLIIILLIIAASITGYFFISKEKPINVNAYKTEKGLVELTVNNTRAGTIKACNRARISPIIGGQIEKLPFKKGSRVNAGDLLLELWNKDIVSELNTAFKEKESVSKKMLEACANYEKTKRTRARYSDIHNKKLISEEEFDSVNINVKTSGMECDAQKAALEAAETRITTAKSMVEKTTIKATFSGTIAEINGEIGEYVTPSPVGVATLPVIDLIDKSCLYVSAPIDEMDAPVVKTGLHAKITVDAFPKKEFKGEIRRIAPYAQEFEKQARTVEVEANFTEDIIEIDMLPGYSADLEITIDKVDNTIRIPTEALINEKSVFIYNPSDKKISKKDVQKGISNWKFTQIISGLNEGDILVTSIEREGVKEGALVNIENM